MDIGLKGHKWSLRVIRRCQFIAGLLVPWSYGLSKMRIHGCLDVLTSPGKQDVFPGAATTALVTEMISE